MYVFSLEVAVGALADLGCVGGPVSGGGSLPFHGIGDVDAEGAGEGRGGQLVTRRRTNAARRVRHTALPALVSSTDCGATRLTDRMPLVELVSESALVDVHEKWFWLNFCDRPL
ncbi:hypothetical protein ACFYPN_12515 [Streptomyces sp. NPDC005576]|uniref:hypothetical protein n=1 Tax=unclassified Streptomyces TaxID=2593676 RepID=UPI0033D7DD12